VVASVGDATGQLAADFGLGALVGVADVDGVAAAIRAGLAISPARRAAVAQRARQELSWERVLQPLIDFCVNPRRAPDRRPDSAIPLGNPFYLGQINHWQVEADRARSTLQELSAHLAEAVAQRDKAQQTVAAYERGRFIRFMRWIRQLA
jgi:hypothetical protein